MILSMTGYGTGSAQKDETTVSVEIKTVNHRFLDLHVRIAARVSVPGSGDSALVRGHWTGDAWMSALRSRIPVRAPFR